MAILPSEPGLEVTIQANGGNLPEFNVDDPLLRDGDEDDTPTEKKLKRYVEAPLGSMFSIQVTLDDSFSTRPDFSIAAALDEKDIHVPHCSISVDEETHKEIWTVKGNQSSQNGKNYIQLLQFSELATIDNIRDVTDQEKEKVAKIGKIKVCFYIANQAQSVTVDSVPHQEFAALNPVPEKALVENSVSQQVGFQAPEEAPDVRFNEVEPVCRIPFATFLFFYRSTRALKDLRIIPCTPEPTPPPTPLEDCDPKTLTLEQLQEALRRVQENARIIKREREKEELNGGLLNGLPGYWEGEVEYVKTESAKRQRQSPTENDEVVDVECEE